MSENSADRYNIKGRESKKKDEGGGWGQVEGGRKRDGWLVGSRRRGKEGHLGGLSGAKCLQQQDSPRLWFQSEGEKKREEGE